MVTEGIKEPHYQFVIREDSSDYLNVRTAVDALITGHTTLVNSLSWTVVCRAHGLTTQSLNARQSQQQGILQASLEPWLSYLDSISEDRIARLITGYKIYVAEDYSYHE